MSGSLLLFIAISAVVIVTPGPDTALTIRNTLLGGRGGGVATAFGVSTGQLIWALAASAFALSAAGGLLRRSRPRRGLEALTGTVLVAL